MVNVAIKSFNSKFIYGFPPANRPFSNDYNQSLATLKFVLNNRKKLKFYERIYDFHLLLFLTNYLSISEDFPVLIEGILTKNNNLIDGFDQLIQAYCGMN
jgi:hypothetical protein